MKSAIKLSKLIVPLSTPKWTYLLFSYLKYIFPSQACNVNILPICILLQCFYTFSYPLGVDIHQICLQFQNPSGRYHCIQIIYTTSSEHVNIANTGILDGVWYDKDDEPNPYDYFLLYIILSSMTLFLIVAWNLFILFYYVMFITIEYIISF